MVTKNGVIVFFVYFCFPRSQRPVSSKMKVKCLHLVTGDKTMTSKEVYYNYYHLKSKYYDWSNEWLIVETANRKEKYFDSEQ